MGSFTLQLLSDSEESNKKTRNANALKILIFILYYVYYNTFEEPLNKHFFERMTNDPSEQKSISFNSLMGKLLLHINTNSKNTKKTDSTNDETNDENSDENSDESEAYSEIINLLAKELSSGLERDLFTNLQATKLIAVNKAFANDVKKTLERGFDEDEDEDEDDDEFDEEDETGSTQFRKKSKQGKKYDKQSQSQSQSSALKPVQYNIAREKITKRIEDNNNIRLFNILNIINATIESHNNQLKYKLSLI